MVLALTLGLFAVASNQASAGGDLPAGNPVLRTAYGATLPGLRARQSAPRQHSSQIILTERDHLPQSREVVIGRGKSTMVELPRNLRDVVVSDPNIVDAVVQTSNRAFLIGKKVGQATAFFFDEYGEQILTLDIGVDNDTSALDTLLARLIPGSRITTELYNDTIILTGTVRNPVDSNRASDIASRAAVTDSPESNSRSTEKVINLLAVEGEEQVTLRVTIAEVQRTLLKQFGINLGAVINSGGLTTSLLTDNALPLTASTLGSLPRLGVPDGSVLAKVYNSGPAGGFANSGIAGGYANGSTSVSGAVRALERVGLLKTLAEPNLTTVSGETAKFLAGGEYPIPIVDSDGKVTVQFKEFGVGLSFTPNVMSEGRISLKIETEVSELTNNGAVTLSGLTIQALKKRQAKTVVELPSGGSLAMAGLVSEDQRQNIDGFPGLKSLPVLGTLFRSQDFQRSETELVVIVTPYVVRPASRQNLARPGDGLLPAHDRPQNFLGHLNRVYGRGSTGPNGGLKGDYGFIVE